MQASCLLTPSGSSWGACHFGHRRVPPWQDGPERRRKLCEERSTEGWEPSHTHTQEHTHACTCVSRPSRSQLQPQPLHYPQTLVPAHEPIWDPAGTGDSPLCRWGQRYGELILTEHSRRHASLGPVPLLSSLTPTLLSPRLTDGKLKPREVKQPLKATQPISRGAGAPQLKSA